MRIFQLAAFCTIALLLTPLAATAADRDAPPLMAPSVDPAAATPGGPRDPGPARWEISARLGSRWITDPAFDLFSDTDAIFTAGIVGEYRPGWLDDRLGLELSLDSSTASATSFGTLKSGLSMVAIGGALAYRLPVHERGQLVARGGGSYDWVSVRFDGELSSGGPALVQTAGILALQATLGYELALLLDPRGQPDSAAVVVRADVGYDLYPTAARFDDVHRDRDDDEKPTPIASRGAALGELDPSGFLLRFGVGLRF